MILSKEPTAGFKEVGRQFIVTFKRKGVEVESEKWSEKWSEKGLTDRQIEIIALIQKDPGSSRKKLAKMLKINPSAVQKHLERLKSKGIVRHIGPDKGGHWEVQRV